LYARTGIDLRTPVRAGDSDEQLAAQLRSLWSERADRGAEDRLAEAERRVFLPLSTLKADPHLEMHTRGG
jgi:cyclic pyranopterin phosphate synthase